MKETQQLQQSAPSEYSQPNKLFNSRLSKAKKYSKNTDILASQHIKLVDDGMYDMVGGISSTKLAQQVSALKAIKVDTSAINKALIQIDTYNADSLCMTPSMDSQAICRAGDRGQSMLKVGAKMIQMPLLQVDELHETLAHVGYAAAYTEEMVGKYCNYNLKKFKSSL